MKKLVFTAIALGFSVGVNAACTRNDLTGTWMVYSSGDNVNASRCQLIFPKKGDVIATTCTDALNNTGTGTFTVSSFDSTCNLRAYLNTDAGSIWVDAFVSKGKDSMSGLWLNTNSLNSGSFNGSKK